MMKKDILTTKYQEKGFFNNGFTYFNDDIIGLNFETQQPDGYNVKRMEFLVNPLIDVNNVDKEKYIETLKKAEEDYTKALVLITDVILAIEKLPDRSHESEEK